MSLAARAARALAWLALLPLAAQAADPPAISLLTVAPGEIYWQRYGHNALLVREAGQARVYNYGMFDFRQKNFFLNFARGRMLYRLDVQPLGWSLELYRREGRWVREQRLALSPEQARALAAFLADNARPENAEYRYDYFRDNCSTRVRDALDRVLGGALRESLESQRAPLSYRHEATRLMSPDVLLALGADALLGPATDAPLNRWQQGFVPMALMDAVRGIEADGRPLIAGERLLVEAADSTPSSTPRYLVPLLVTGLLLAALLVGLARRDARWPFALVATGVSLFAGVFGVVIALGWAFTEHWAMAANPHLLLFNPLCLLLLPTWLRGAPAPWQKHLALFIAALAPLALAGGGVHWPAFWLPVHAALAWTVRRM